MKVLRNLEHLEYTFEHRQAFAFTAAKLFGTDPLYPMLEKRARLHDLDKAFLYSLVSKQDASAFHKLVSSHHIENTAPKSKLDLLEAYVDWDCAGYTKPDKPDNAWDALRRICPRSGSQLIRVARWYNIDWSYPVVPEDCEWKSFSAAPATKANIAHELHAFAMESPALVSRLRLAARDIEEIGVEAAARKFLCA